MPFRMCLLGSQFHHRPRFPGPPCDPGRSGFPSPVLTLAFPSAACPQPTRLKRWLIYTPRGCGLLTNLVPFLRANATPALCPGPAPRPPSAQGPFARTGCYPARHGVRHRVVGRYPDVLAPTGPRARPPVSSRLRCCPYTAGLCRLLPAPAAGWPFPTLSPRPVHRRLDPYPAALHRCLPVSSRWTTASPQRVQARRAR